MSLRDGALHMSLHDGPLDMDLFVISKIRSLSKQRKRAKKLLTEAQQPYSEAEVLKQHEEIERNKTINYLIQTIKAMQLVGGDTSSLKLRLDELLKRS